jgi:putative peptidoglycan lipid II flippase
VEEAQADASAGRRVASAALLLAASVLASRLLGFGRDVVLAGLVGRNAQTDAYSAGFMLPDLLNHLLAGGALSIAFLPVYERIRKERGAAAGQRFTATALGTMGALALAATAAMFVWADPLVAWQFGFPPEVHALTVRLTRIVLPAQLCFVCGGILRAALMADGHFRSQAAAPLLYNLGIIAGGVALAGATGVEGFAWGALGGAVVGALGSALWEARGRVPVGLRVAPRDPDFRAYLMLAAPLALGASLLTVDEWYDRWFGARLDEGTIATLRYARQLLLIPVALVGQAVATAALPTLSRYVAEGRSQELDRLVDRSLQASLALGVLLGAGLFAVAAPAVTFVYVRGAFTPADAAPVVEALRVFAFAVPGWIVQTLAVRPFYARGEMWRPMALATLVSLAVLPLYAALGPRLGATGLALAGTFSISLSALVTLGFARRWHGAPGLSALLRTGLRTFAAAAPAAWLAGLVAEHVAARTGAGTLGAALAVGAGGLVFGAVALPLAWRLGDAATRNALTALARRLRRRRGR